MNCSAPGRPLRGAMTECRRSSRVAFLKKPQFDLRPNMSKWIWRTSVCARTKRRRETSRPGRSNRRCIAHGSTTTRRCRGACKCTRTFSFTASKKCRDTRPHMLASACRWRAPIPPSGSTIGSTSVHQSASEGIGRWPLLGLKSPLFLVASPFKRQSSPLLQSSRAS